MKLFRMAVVACLAAGLAGSSGSSTGHTKDAQASGKAPEAEKVASSKDKIVGTWEVTKSKDVPPGATLEFTKDRKLKLKATVEGERVTMEGRVVCYPPTWPATTSPLRASLATTPHRIRR
jgi:hypothetical protein